ncbi:MAG: GDP-mannose 4,6-dehydratase, partial [Acetobacteraceae bacterium]|nr:GDP-mannose 4,6-dehydratase [Acetobacteraceae bacterium]
MWPHRILVTGAGGFVASHLIPALHGAFPGTQVVGAGHQPRPGLHPLDVTDPQSVSALVERLRPDACVHLAAIAAIAAARETPRLAWSVNLQGTLALAEAIFAHAPECLLVYVSSADIYGASFRCGRPLDEDAAPAPLNTYGATKAAADLALGALSAERQLRVVRVRPFNHTGPRQSADFVVPAFARQVARIAVGLQEPVIHTGALDPQRDFLDVRDVCQAYVACLRTPPEAGTVLNLASGVPRRVGDILADLLDRSGVKALVRPVSHLLRPSDIPVGLGHANRARMLLGWEPRIPWS